MDAALPFGLRIRRLPRQPGDNPCLRETAKELARCFALQLGCDSVHGLPPRGVANLCASILHRASDLYAVNRADAWVQAVVLTKGNLAHITKRMMHRILFVGEGAPTDASRLLDGDAYLNGLIVQHRRWLWGRDDGSVGALQARLVSIAHLPPTSPLILEKNRDRARVWLGRVTHPLSWIALKARLDCDLRNSVRYLHALLQQREGWIEEARTEWGLRPAAAPSPERLRERAMRAAALATADVRVAGDDDDDDGGDGGDDDEGGIRGDAEEEGGEGDFGPGGDPLEWELDPEDGGDVAIDIGAAADGDARPPSPHFARTRGFLPRLYRVFMYLGLKIRSGSIPDSSIPQMWGAAHPLHIAPVEGRSNIDFLFGQGHLRPGQTPGASFKTDGFSLCRLALTPLPAGTPRPRRRVGPAFKGPKTEIEKATEMSRLVDTLHATSRHDGEDTGQILVSVIGRRGGRTLTLSGRGYDHAIGLKARTRASNALDAPLAPVFAALAEASPKTSTWEGTVRNLAVMQEHRAAIWAVRSLPHWRVSAFESWRLSQRCLARHYGSYFAGSMRDGTRSEAALLGRGNAKFESRGRPTTALGVAATQAAKSWRPLLERVDGAFVRGAPAAALEMSEHGTSMYCGGCGGVLSDVHVLKGLSKREKAAAEVRAGRLERGEPVRRHDFNPWSASSKSRGLRCCANAACPWSLAGGAFRARDKGSAHALADGLARLLASERLPGTFYRKRAGDPPRAKPPPVFIGASDEPAGFHRRPRPR